MSVIVKGGRMPKSCMECVINYSFFRMLKCSELKGMKGFKKLPHEHDRHQDCPLIELPEKHGRLIDADALLNTIYELDFECDVPVAKRHGNMVLHDLVPQIIYDAPTILDKEE